MCIPLVALYVVAPTCLAGDPTPPAGPVGPTFKTLDEVEPSTPIGPVTTPGDADAVFVISQPGPYHLTADVIGQAAKHGIQITASGVTLDLRASLCAVSRSPSMESKQENWQRSRPTPLFSTEL